METNTQYQGPFAQSKQYDKTQIEQSKIESTIGKIYMDINLKEMDLAENERGQALKLSSTLQRAKTAKYLRDFTKKHTLTQGFDHQKTWVMFFLLYGLELLGEEGMTFSEFSELEQLEICDYLSKFWNEEDGGFSGTGGFLSHLGTTYPLLLSIVIMARPEAYELLDPASLKRWIISLKQPGVKGSYLIHADGEADLRAVYIAILAAKLMNFLDDDITEGVAEYIAKCQTYEGGLAPIPNGEAHAGYTFCGVGALCLLGRLDELDLPRLINWMTLKQKELEGGFCGRTNKIVDSCYSVWVGAVFSMLNEYSGFNFNLEGKLLYDQLALQKYVLFTCQNPEGGLKDKCTKKADFYHTTYSMAGLSLSQRLKESQDGETQYIHLHETNQNLLADIDPAFNMPREKVSRIINHFKTQQIYSKRSFFSLRPWSSQIPQRSK